MTIHQKAIATMIAEALSGTATMPLDARATRISTLIANTLADATIGRAARFNAETAAYLARSL